MDSHPCTCRGENQNCFKCDGTGMVDSKPAPPHPAGRFSPHKELANSRRTIELRSPGNRTSPPRKPNKPSKAHRPPPNNQSSDGNGRIICRACDKTFSFFTELQNHTYKLHILKKSAKKERPTQNISTCPKCNCRVRNLEKHIRRNHPPGSKIAQKARPSKKHKTIQGKNEKQTRPDRAISTEPLTTKPIFTCGFCMATQVGRDELLNHLERVHGEKLSRTVTLTKPLRPDRSKPLSSSRPQNTSPSAKSTDQHGVVRMEDSRYERLLDATYGMGGTARDNGQFGSAATYDGMDDESFS